MRHLLARWVFWATLACALAGCGSLELYNKQKDTQAQALQTSLKDVSFSEVFNTARANHDAVSQAITDAHQKLTDIDARQRLFVVLTHTGKMSEPLGLIGKLDERWAQLICGSTPCDDPETLARAWRAQFCQAGLREPRLCKDTAGFSRIVDIGLQRYDESSLDTLRVRVAEDSDHLLTSSGKRPPLCVAALRNPQPAAGTPARAIPAPTPALIPPEAFEKGLPEGANPAIGTDYEDYYDDCTKLLLALYRLDWLVGLSSSSDVGQAYDAWRQADLAVTAQQMAAQQAQQEYQASKQAYQDALKQIDADDPKAEERAKDLLAKAGKALDAVADLQKAAEGNPFGIKIAADERLQELREIVAALGGATSTATGGDKAPLTADVRNRLAAISTLPHLFDEAADLFDEADKARLSPLVLEISYQEQVSIAARRRIEWLQAAAARQKARYLATVAEAEAIARAKENVLAANSMPGFDSKPLYELLDGGAGSSASPGQKKLMQALVDFYESQVKFRALETKLAFDDAAMTFQRNLYEDEIALNQWLDLSKSDANILAAYFASGIKPEELASLLVQLIGLGSIGVGVNR